MSIKQLVKELTKRRGVKRIPGLHVQRSGDGCSVPGEVLVFVPNTKKNRELLHFAGPNPQGTLYGQFTVTTESEAAR